MVVEDDACYVDYVQMHLADLQYCMRMCKSILLISSLSQRVDDMVH